MTDMLSRIKQNIEQGSSPTSTPIVDSALVLVNDKTIEFSQRLPRIYQLVDDAVTAGGAEQERAGFIIESLFASATVDEMDMMNTYNEENA
jgi:hypothetical protein